MPRAAPRVTVFGIASPPLLAYPESKRTRESLHVPQRQDAFHPGASRGIGLAVALRAARDGANVAIAAKTQAPHPKLSGTIHTAAAAGELENARPVVRMERSAIRDSA